MTTTSDADADVNASKTVAAEQEHGLHDLHTEHLRLSEVEGLTVQTDEAPTLLGDSHGNSGTLAAENLDLLGLGRQFVLCFKADMSVVRLREGTSDGHTKTRLGRM